MVVGDDGRPCRVRVVAGTRSPDAAGLRPGRGRRSRRSRSGCSGPTRTGKTRSHAPDYFARRADGSAVVVDCRPVERIKPQDAATFDATRRGLRAARLASTGWSAPPDADRDARTSAGWPATAIRVMTSPGRRPRCAQVFADAGAADGRRRGGRRPDRGAAGAVPPAVAPRARRRICRCRCTRTPWSRWR